MRTIEVEAKSLKEATKMAGSQLCCDEQELEIEILETKEGIFGIGKKIRIRASAPEDSNSELNESEEKKTTVPDWAINPDFDTRMALETICHFILPEATVTESMRDERRLFDINGDGSGIFIGRKGQTLEALQFIINKMNLKQVGSSEHILVDTEDYILRRIESLQEKAKSMAHKTRKTKRPQISEPLNAHDRRIIHTTIHDDPDISTRSIGDGEFKRVQILLIDKD